MQLNSIVSKKMPILFNNKAIVKFIFILNLLVLFYFVIFYQNLTSWKRATAGTYVHFNSDVKGINALQIKNEIQSRNLFRTANESRQQPRKQILLITDSYNSNTSLELSSLFESLRFDYKILLVSRLVNNPKRIPGFFHKNAFSLIVIDSPELLLNDKYSGTKRAIFELSNYFHIGLVIFFKRIVSNSQIGHSRFNQTIDVQFKYNSPINECRLHKLNDLNAFFRITKFNDKESILSPRFRQKDSTEFASFANYDLKCYEPVVRCTSGEVNLELILKTSGESSCSTQRAVLIGTDLSHLIVTPSLLLDFIEYASHGSFSVNLKRYVQIDIDDIFVGAKNTRMANEDVRALIRFQDEYLNKFVFFSAKPPGSKSFG